MGEKSREYKAKDSGEKLKQWFGAKRLSSIKKDFCLSKNAKIFHVQQYLIIPRGNKISPNQLFVQYLNQGTIQYPEHSPNSVTLEMGLISHNFPLQLSANS